MSLLKSISFLVIALAFCKAIGSLQSFVVAKTLEPQGFGIWITLLLVASYSPIVCLGTMEAMLKEVPFYLGRQNFQRVKQIEGVVMASITASGLFFVALGVGTALILPDGAFETGSAFLGLWFTAIGLNCFSSFFYYRFMAHEDFRCVSLMDSFRSIVAVLLVPGGAWLWGLRGAVVGYLFHELMMFSVLAALNVRLQGAIKPHFDWPQIKHIVRVGFPITVLWWVLTLQASVDRIVLGGFLGPSAVGHFGLGIAITGGLALVPTAVGRVLYPRVNKAFGARDDFETLRVLVLDPTRLLGMLLANVQVVVLGAMPFLFKLVLPKYAPGLRAGEILMLGGFSICLLRNGANYLIAAHLEKTFLRYILLSLVFNVGSDVTLVLLGAGIDGVAIGTVAAGFLLNALVWSRVSSDLCRSLWERFGLIVEIYMPMLVLASCVGCLELVVPGLLEAPNSTFLSVCGGLLVLLNVCLMCSAVHRAQIFGLIRAGRKMLAKRKNCLEAVGQRPHEREGDPALQS